MKKLLNVAAVAMALCGLMLTSCASGGAKADAPVSVHPRSYTFDVIDGSAEVKCTWNQYGPNYQATPFFTGLVKKDKPQAGDTVTFKMKATSDVDLPLLLCYPCSTSPNWTNLAESLSEEEKVFARDVKAGVPFEAEITFVLEKKVAADFALCIQYDNPDQDPKAGTPCNLTLERVCESTDTTKEVPAAPHIAHVDVDLGKYAAFLEIATNHPWVNGAQDMSVISNYQATPEVTRAWGDELPIEGDTVTITWNAVSDNNIAKLYIRPVDCSAAVSYWDELIVPAWGEDGDTTAQDEQMLFGENIVAGEPFSLTKTFTFAKNATAQVNFCLWYEVDAGDGPAICKIVRE